MRRVVFVAMGFLVGVCEVSGFGGTITQTASFDSGGPAGTIGGSYQQFNPALGQLNDVTFEITAAVSSRLFEIRNISGSTQTFTASGFVAAGFDVGTIDSGTIRNTYTLNDFQTLVVGFRVPETTVFGYLRENLGRYIGTGRIQ